MIEYEAAPHPDDFSATSSEDLGGCVSWDPREARPACPASEKNWIREKDSSCPASEVFLDERKIQVKDAGTS